jgi:DNA invertase Pin-like site-specific DNA recombinase
MKARLEVLLPSDIKVQVCRAAKAYGLSSSEYLLTLINRCVPSAFPAETLAQKRAKQIDTLIPQQTVRLMLKDRAQDPPIPYRELAEKYGYALRTVHRACTAQGGYRTKVKRSALGRKSKLSPEQRAEILLDSSSLTVLQLSRKYDVPRATVYRVINGEGCYAS